jgi:hypothetical protein
MSEVNKTRMGEVQDRRPADHENVAWSLCSKTGAA